MLTFSDPHDFNQLKLRLCWPLPQFYAEFSSAQALHGYAYTTQAPHEYVCTLTLKLPQVCCLGEKLLWEKSQVFSLFAAGNKSFLLLIFGLVVSFGSTPTKRQTQCLDNKSTDYSISPSTIIQSELGVSLLPNTSPCAQCTVRLLQGHEKRMCGSCSPKPWTPRRVSAKYFEGQVREGGS